RLSARLPPASSLRCPCGGSGSRSFSLSASSLRPARTVRLAARLSRDSRWPDSAQLFARRGLANLDVFPRSGADSRCPNRHLLIIEASDLADDLVETVLDGKVPGVQPVQLGMRNILEIRLAPLACEEDVVLSPDNDRLRLLLSEERLPLWVELYVRPIVVEEIELDPSCVGPVEIVQVHVPVVGADELRPAMAVGVDQLDSVGL